MHKIRCIFTLSPAPKPNLRANPPTRHVASSDANPPGTQPPFAPQTALSLLVVALRLEFERGGSRADSFLVLDDGRADDSRIDGADDAEAGRAKCHAAFKEIACPARQSRSRSQGGSNHRQRALHHPHAAIDPHGVVRRRQFEDHASMVFINRKLPVPKFHQMVEPAWAAARLTLTTDALTLTYSTGGDGHFTAGNLSITLTVNGKQIVWHPGLGRPRKPDGHDAHPRRRAGSKTRSPSSRASSRAPAGRWWTTPRGRSSTRPTSAFKGEKSPWPWVMARPANEAPQDCTSSATGTITARRSATSSSRRPHSAAAAFCLRCLVVALLGLQRPGAQRAGARLPRERPAARRARHRHGLAPDRQEVEGHGRDGPVGPELGWTGYTWNKELFPDPESSCRACTRRAQNHDQSPSRLGRSAI